MTRSLPALAGRVLLALATLITVTCTDDEDDGTQQPPIVGPTADVISVTMPSASTIWHGGSCCDTIRWSQAKGDSVELRLFVDSTLRDLFPVRTANDGEYVIESPIPTDLDGASEYRVRVLDNAGNQGWSQVFSVKPDSMATIMVSSPLAQSTWTAGAPPPGIVWSVGGSGGAMVRIELYRKGAFVAVLNDSTPNDGTETTSSAIDFVWGSGHDFMVKVVDDKGHFGWSKPFSIQQTFCASMTISQPDTSTRWTHGQEGVVIAWTKTCADSVKLELRKNDVLVDTLSPWIPNTGTYSRTAIVRESWGDGRDFQIRVVDRTQNFGYSRRFTIALDTLDSISINAPATSTVWRWGQDSLHVRWSGAKGDSAQGWLYQNGIFVGQLFAMTAAESALTVPGAILKQLGSKGPFVAVKIMDNTGRRGWSSTFRIDTTGGIRVTSPSSSDIWLHGAMSRTVAWTGNAKDSVRALMYKSDSLVGVFAEWVGAKDQILVRDSALPASWGIGRDFRIRLVDKEGNYGWSERLTVVADTTPIISVLHPDSASVWYLKGPREKTVRISWSETDTILGDSVRCILFSGSRVIDTLGGWKKTDSTLVVDADLSRVTPGADFRIKVIDNDLHHGWSARFRVAADSMNTIGVSRPDSILYRGQTDLAIAWTGSDSDSVAVLIVRGDAVVDTFASRGDDSGRTVRTAPIPATWGTGAGFRLKVMTNDGSYGYSSTFSIEADSLKRIIVTFPTADVIWHHGDTATLVTWRKLVGHPTTADSVVVYKGDTYLGLFAACTGSDLDSCGRSAPIPVGWGTGSDFRLRVTDQDGHYGWSEMIEVQAKIE